MLLMMVVVLALMLGTGGGHMGLTNHEGPAHDNVTAPAETSSGPTGNQHSDESPK